MDETTNGFRGRYHFLSNFAPSPIVVEGVRYATVEHAFQAAKTLDPDERVRIAVAPTPGRAKALGRRVALRDGWDADRFDVMLELLRLKFADPHLRRRLLDTGATRLVEHNGWGDRVWGVCDGRGENWLGLLLEQVREELR